MPSGRHPPPWFRSLPETEGPPGRGRNATSPSHLITGHVRFPKLREHALSLEFRPVRGSTSISEKKGPGTIVYFAPRSSAERRSEGRVQTFPDGFGRKPPNGALRAGLGIHSLFSIG